MSVLATDIRNNAAQTMRHPWVTRLVTVLAEPNGRHHGSPRYLVLAEAIASHIELGVILAGERLPSERDLAALLGLSRTTVVAAYRELGARGLVRGHVGRGTFTCPAPDPLDPPVIPRTTPEAPFAWRGKVALRAERALDPGIHHLVRAGTEPGIISFAAGAPALDQFPLAAYRSAMERALAETSPLIGIAPVEGDPVLRSAIARWTRTDAERILIISGAQQGLDLIARCLLDPGDVVIMDRPGYLGAIHAFRAAGAHLVGWDAERANLDELEDLLLRYRPKFIYTCPTFQNPTGRTFSEPRRRELLQLATRYRTPVVSDDPYRDLPFPDTRSVPPAMAALDSGDLVIQLDTFSKMLSGGLRLGWVTAAPAIIDHLTRLKANSDVSCPGLAQRALATLLHSSIIDDHVSLLRKVHHDRYQTMAAALNQHFPSGSLGWAAPRGGLYIWLRLTDRKSNPLSAAVLAQQARRCGVAFGSGMAFFPDAAPGYPGPGQDHLRLCFSAHAAPTIVEGMGRLAAALRYYP